MKAKKAIKTVEKWANRLLETNLMDFKEDRIALLEALKKVKKLVKPKA